MLVLAIGLMGLANVEAGDMKEPRCFELRVYTAAPGKMEALHARFREHTCKLFDKHGMTNIGYFVPTDSSDQRLVYVLAYPDPKARAKSWGAFIRDPDWIAAWKESEKDGKLVTKVESTVLHAVDYSPAVSPQAKEPSRVFELRTYTASPGNLDRLNARFRNHTLGLFSKHGMEHVGYWVPNGKGSDNTLIYLLAHASAEARDACFKAFSDDPAWKEAREASEKEAGGSLTAKDGVQSLMLVPTDYSPMK
jgi:hypothetical protein